MLLSDSFWESVTKIVFYDFTEEIYETLIREELEAIKEIFAQISYKEIDTPEDELERPSKDMVLRCYGFFQITNYFV